MTVTRERVEEIRSDALAEQVKSLTAERDTQKNLAEQYFGSGVQFRNERDRLAARVERLREALAMIPTLADCYVETKINACVQKALARDDEEKGK